MWIDVNTEQINDYPNDPLPPKDLHRVTFILVKRWFTKETQRRHEEHSSELDICQAVTLIAFYQLANAQNEY